MVIEGLGFVGMVIESEMFYFVGGRVFLWVVVEEMDVWWVRGWLGFKIGVDGFKE
jgi:hypothetical protein